MTAPANEQSGLRDESLQTVRQALANMQFGSITLTVHEGRVVQIDVTEKRRLSTN